MDIKLKDNFVEVDEFLLNCDLMRPLSDDEIEALQRDGLVPKGEMTCQEE